MISHRGGLSGWQAVADAWKQAVWCGAVLCSVLQCTMCSAVRRGLCCVPAWRRMDAVLETGSDGDQPLTILHYYAQWPCTLYQSNIGGSSPLVLRLRVTDLLWATLLTLWTWVSIVSTKGLRIAIRMVGQWLVNAPNSTKKFNWGRIWQAISATTVTALQSLHPRMLSSGGEWADSNRTITHK